jgi:hypothetical protein
MSIHTDPSAAHAVYAPSSAHRWTVCTASAQGIAALGEQEEGDAAKKGTAAHEELERCLAGGEPDPEHASAYAVALALAYLRGLPPGQMWVEQRVHLTEQIWGRCDVAHWHPESETLTIVDLKDGFVDVPVEENEQLRIYAAGSIYTHKLPAKWIRLVVVQPNSIIPGPRVKQWVESAETLFAFAERTAAIPAGPLTFVAGETCKYCPLFGICPASQDVLLRLNAMLASPPDTVPAAQVKIFLATKKPVTDWFSALEKAATKAALSGKVPDGMKLVQTTKHRDWTDAAAARQEIVNVLGEGALELPTPAQAEKLGMAKEDVSSLASKPEGGPALAFESDRRPVWAAKTAAEMFAGVTGGTAK